MTKQEKITVPARPTGLDLMREPFPAHQISKLPKPTKKQTEIVRNDYKQGIRCKLCGQWHHPDVQHLDYVGHAALTDRLLECDPNWNWEPMAFDERGLPLITNGGMWIKLTVCGQTRMGFGDAPNKQGGDAIKEVIGDALRNAAMRFGAALDLWHKGELHVNDDDDGNAAAKAALKQTAAPQGDPEPDTSQHEIVCGQMIGGIRSQGVDVITNHPRFNTDLALLRSQAPELAAQVDAEIETHKQAAKPDLALAGDEIPY